MTAYPCKSTSPSEVMTKLHEWMDTFHLNPKTICTDMAFHQPHDMQAFYRMRNVKRLPTGPHTPWPNRAGWVYDCSRNSSWHSWIQPPKPGPDHSGTNHSCPVETDGGKRCQGPIAVHFRQRHLCLFHTRQEGSLPLIFRTLPECFPLSRSSHPAEVCRGEQTDSIERNEPDYSTGHSKSKNACTFSNSPCFVLDNVFARDGIAHAMRPQRSCRCQ